MSLASLRIALTAALLAGVVPAAVAGEEGISLEDGPGVDLVMARCALCHSLDYVTMSAPVMTPALWDKSVAKMIRVMGAPVSAEEARTVLAYLDAHYALGH